MKKALILMAIRAMKTNPIRSLLTTTGIFIGTALVVVVLQLGATFEALILEQIASIQPESLYIEVKAPSRKDSDGALEVRTMTLEDVEALKKIPNIEKGHGVVYHQAKVSSSKKSVVRMLMGVGASYASMNVLPMSHGSFFTEAQDKSQAAVLVLGSDIAKDLFGSKNPVGEKLRLEGRAYEVQGVVAPIGSKFFLNMDETIYLPTTTLNKKILGKTHLLAISLEMKDSAKIKQTVFMIEKTMRRLHKINDPDKDDFVVRTMDQAMSIVGSITSGISILLFGVAGISMVVGGIGIMNIMYVTVAERTTEIGLKKAVGASPFAIRFQFMAEAIIMTIFGAILGVIAALIFVFIVAQIAQFLGFNWIFTVQLQPIIVALTSSCFIAIVFGYAPANKAAKLSPILALRRS